MTERNEPDWAHERDELRRFILHRLKTRSGHAIDDRELDLCAQDACVSLYRWWCRERADGRPIKSLDAMKNRVAGFAAVDLIRGKIRRNRFVPIGPEGDLIIGPDDQPAELGSELSGEPARYVDSPERLRFLMIAYFKRANNPCCDLARHFLEDRGWPAVAADLGLSVDAVKQRWSRCLKEFRRFLTENPECEEWVFEEMP